MKRCNAQIFGFRYISNFQVLADIYFGNSIDHSLYTEIVYLKYEHVTTSEISDIKGSQYFWEFTRSLQSSIASMVYVHREEVDQFLCTLRLFPKLRWEFLCGIVHRRRIPHCSSFPKCWNLCLIWLKEEGLHFNINHLPEIKLNIFAKQNHKINNFK